MLEIFLMNYVDLFELLSLKDSLHSHSVSTVKKFLSKWLNDPGFVSCDIKLWAPKLDKIQGNSVLAFRVPAGGTRKKTLILLKLTLKIAQWTIIQVYPREHD